MDTQHRTTGEVYFVTFYIWLCNWIKNPKNTRTGIVNPSNSA